jgi:GH35 family endo-1,4-beta-xylanase
MKLKKTKLTIAFTLLIVLTSVFSNKTYSQSYSAWYKKAQERIDTLRKGNFGIQILDKDGNPYSGDVSVRLKKHEFPFGIAFDLKEGSGSMGNTYSTTAVIKADADAEIYQTERWNKFFAYLLPVKIGKEYKLTLKFSEIYANSAKSRLFDVYVESELFLNDYDVFAEAGGKNIAKDTSIVIYTTDGALNIEFNSVVDNAMIKGITLEEIGSSEILRINCGGQALTTSDGNKYQTETGFFDPDAETVASNEKWMKAAMYKYFNYGVSGNSFKWSGIQPQHVAPDYSWFDNAVNWTQKVGWDLRAHTLLWGGNDAHSMPDWVRALPTPKAITDTCKMRVQREVAHYKGIIKEYDVINEPLSGHADWLRKTVGDSILWNCFKWAREVDPDAELYINDYNVELNWGQSKEYRDLIKRIREMGGPVTGVGIQAHFWDCCRPNVDEIVKNLNIIAEAGLPMRLTEYDWGKDLTEKQQVDDFVMVATIAFSHPSVNGMICWGLNDEGAWRENSGFFYSDYRPKLAADTLLYYTKVKWATNFDSTMTEGNAMNFNAYYGDYTIEVNFNGEIKEFTIPCLKENKDSIFTLIETDALLKGPMFINAEMAEKNSVRLLFDKPIDSNSLKRSDFKFFSKKGIGLISVESDPKNEKSLILSLSNDVTEGDPVYVSYFPGKLKATDGSIAKAFGPEEIKNEKKVSSENINNNYTVKVFPNPATDQLCIENPNNSISVTLYNSLGMSVLKESSNTGIMNINVAQLKRGLYIVKIKDSNDYIYYQKVILK